ncbi:MAG: ABC transporter permease [Alphaproteobacteria bacterium]
MTMPATDTPRLRNAQSPMQRRWQRFRHHRMAMASSILLAAMILLALLAPGIAALLDIDPAATDLFNRFAEPGNGNFLGTDEAGRDVFLRLLYGGQVSLGVGLASAIASGVIGALIGLVAGYYGGHVDSALMRITDAVIALPLLPLLIVLAAVDLTKLGFSVETATDPAVSAFRMIFILTVFGWTTAARLVRAETLALRQRDFIRAAEALGARPLRLLFLHILPNIGTPLVVATTLSIGNVILFESVLSFLGLGIQPPMPSWGNMLTNAQDVIWDAPLLAVWPGMSIFLTVIAFNFLGDGLQFALNPKTGTTSGMK